MSEDREIVRAVLDKRAGAFERLITRHQALVWHLVHRMVRQPEDARELCQDVFLRVHDCLYQYRFESSLATWIGRVAFSIATRHLQKKRLSLVSEFDGENGESLFDRVSDDFDLEAASTNRESMQHLAQAIEGLPPLQRTLITLYHLDEMSVVEIAQITELPIGTVKNYLFRARLKLRQALEHSLGLQVAETVA